MRADLQLFDHLLDFLRRALGAMGEVAHLVRHHREAPASLACPRSLDGSVEGQQVGLLGNALDHFQDVADVHGLGIQRFDLGAGSPDLLGQLAHGGDILLDDLAPVLGILARTAGL